VKDKKKMKEEAKRAAISKMKDMLTKSMGKRLADSGMMKATVVAKDEEGLEEGLKKAQDVLEAKEGLMHESMEKEGEDSSEEMDIESMTSAELKEALKKRLKK